MRILMKVIGKMRRKKGNECPGCGGPSIPIRYGLPGADMMEDAEKGLVKLGGCLIQENAPTNVCLGCGREFKNQ